MHSGPAQLEIARRLAPFGRLLLIIFYPIAYPLAKMLDYLVGVDEDELMTRDELQTMIKLTRSLAIQKLEDEWKKEKDPEASIENERDRKNILLPAEVDAITGILTLTKKTVKDLMIPITEVHMVSTDHILDTATLSTIDRIGHSRLPVYKGSDRNLIAGFLFVKKLITCTPNSPLGTCSAIRTPLYIDSSRSLFEVLDMFQTGKSHIAIVSHNVTKLLNVFYAADKSPSPDCAPCGILTIEDIIEAILQEQIYDEEDHTRNSISPTAMTSVLRALRKRPDQKEKSNSAMFARTISTVSNASNASNLEDSKAKRNAFFRRSQSTTAANPIGLDNNDFKITGNQSLLGGGGARTTSRASDDDQLVPNAIRNSRL